MAGESVQGEEGARLTGEDGWKVGKGMAGVRWVREGLWYAGKERGKKWRRIGTPK